MLFAKVFAQSSGNAPASQVINNSLLGVRRVPRAGVERLARQGSFTASSGATASNITSGVRRLPRTRQRQQVGARRTTSRRG
jgi:hypothetical protein